MTKLCPRGKAAAKRKFKVYPSAYANAYASKICAGKIKDPSGVKRKDFRGPKPAGKAEGGPVIGSVKRNIKDNQDRIKSRTKSLESRPKDRMSKPARRPLQKGKKMGTAKPLDPRKFQKPRERVKGYMGGGMTMMPRAMYGKGGGVCKRGMGRAYGKNS